VVFLHGLGAKAQDWQPVIEKLDLSKHRVVAIDLLGFGESPKPDWKEYSADDHASAVANNIKSLKVKKPIVLVGHSMGALIAARIARKYPKLVKHLVLYEIPVYADMPAQNVSDIRNRAYLKLFDTLVKNPKRTMRMWHFLGKVASSFVPVAIKPSSWIPFERSLKNTIMQDSIYKDLIKIKIPVDVIYGQYDLVVIKRTMKKLFKSSLNVKFHKVNETHRITPKTGSILNELLQENTQSNPMQ